MKYWPLPILQQALEQTALNASRPVKELVRELRPDLELEDFWQSVEANLRSGRVRMIFVADRLPRAGGDGVLFTFEIDHLPAGKDPYLVEVTHRGQLQAHKADDNDYIVIGSIGDSLMATSTQREERNTMHGHRKHSGRGKNGRNARIVVAVVLGGDRGRPAVWLQHHPSGRGPGGPPGRRHRPHRHRSHAGHPSDGPLTAGTA